MTINIVLVTNEALIMGCDSIASSTTPAINPFEADIHKDADGKPIKDADGNFLLVFKPEEITTQVTTLLSGVTKGFKIYEKPDVVALTAGLAQMNSRSMQTISEEFFEKQKTRKQKLVNVEAIAKAYLRFLRAEYLRHYKKSPLPKEIRSGPELLVGGFSKHEIFPSIYRVKVKENTCERDFKLGEFGLCWNGQADSVERFIRGYDSILKPQIESAVSSLFDRHHERMRDKLVEIVNEILTKLGANMPDGVEMKLPSRGSAKLPWDGAKLAFDYGNMPLQNAIDFVAWLVLMQSGRAKFASGLPTVGGRTHICIIRKSVGAVFLGEQELENRYTGFAHDL